MRVQVRNPAGMLLGHIELSNLRLLLGSSVRFACALDSRYYGAGYRELPDSATDPAFPTVDIPVAQFVTPPQIGAYGGYYPGRVDFIFRWSGPIGILDSIPAFTRTP